MQREAAQRIAALGLSSVLGCAQEITLLLTSKLAWAVPLCPSAALTDPCLWRERCVSPTEETGRSVCGYVPGTGGTAGAPQGWGWESWGEGDARGCCWRCSAAHPSA